MSIHLIDSSLADFGTIMLLGRISRIDESGGNWIVNLTPYWYLALFVNASSFKQYQKKIVVHFRHFEQN